MLHSASAATSNENEWLSPTRCAILLIGRACVRRRQRSGVVSPLTNVIRRGSLAPSVAPVWGARKGNSEQDPLAPCTVIRVEEGQYADLVCALLWLGCPQTTGQCLALCRRGRA